MQDITGLVREAASRLEYSELLKASSFTLYDGIHTLPIMDPAMDAGMFLESAKNRGFMDTDEIHLPVSNIRLSLIFDRLMVFFIEWLNGRPITQTLMSCVYFRNIDGVANTVLKIILNVFRHCMRISLKTIMSAGIYFEEDFMPDLKGFTLDTYIDLAEDLRILIITFTNHVQMDSYGDIEQLIHPENVQPVSNQSSYSAILERIKLSLAMFELWTALESYQHNQVPELCAKASGYLIDVVNSALKESNLADGTLKN